MAFPAYLRRVKMIAWLCCLACFLGDSSSAGASAPVFQVRDRDLASTEQTLAYLSGLRPEAVAQRKVWVFFTDKEIFDSASCAGEIQRVAVGFDRHTAARRIKVLGPDLADYHDIPVVERYVTDLRSMGAEPINRSRWLNAVSVRAPLAVLARIGATSYVHKIVLVRGAPVVQPVPALQMPGGGARELFDYGPSLGQLEEITITDVHEAGLSGDGVIVAMLDTGYHRDHPAFAQLQAEGRLLAQWDFINNDGETQNEPGDPENQDFHGTATWSIVGGFHEGELIGGAYGASFLLAKTEDISQEVPQEEDNWVAGAEWADAMGADVINSSLSYLDWYTYEDMDGNTAVTTIAADIAVGRGIVVCTSAGNWGTQDWYYIAAPADGDSVIAVGGTRPDGEMWDESSHGPTYDGRIKPEVVARGDDTVGAVLLGTIPNEPDAIYWPLSGTSVAAPLVTSAAALILEAHPDWSPMMLREQLMMTADNAETPDNWRGWGRINAMAAIGTIVSAPETIGLQAPRLSVWPNPSSGEVRFRVGVSAARAGESVLEIYTLDGKRVRRFADLTAAEPVLWDGRDGGGRRLPAGTYLTRLRVGDWQTTEKVIVTR